MTLCKCGSKTVTHRRECNRCIYQRRKVTTPLKLSYWGLVSSARRRNKPFDLTFEQFCEFATKTEYITKKGITATGYHIDRIDEGLGYTYSNLQLLLNGDNVRKYKKFVERSRNGQLVMTTVTVKTSQSDEDCPF